MKLSQFDLVDCPAGNVTDRVVHSTASVGATVINAANDIDGLDPNAKLYVCKYSDIRSSCNLLINNKCRQQSYRATHLNLKAL